MRAQSYVFGPYRLDADRAVLMREGSVLEAGNRALSVLTALIAAEGRVVTKSELLATAWPRAVVEESNLTVQIAALRKLLGPAPGGGDWIATVSRVGYRFAYPVAVDEGSASRGRSGVVPEPRKPSILVLPFVNLTRDIEQEYFADGITEDVIMALSRFRWFLVMARNTSFAYKGKGSDVREIAAELGVAYVLEGSVRRMGDRVRIAVQLVDGASCVELWADRYDFDVGDIFAVQDRITEQVVGAIEPALLKTESDSSTRRGTDRQVGAWDLVCRGTYYFHQLTRDTHWRARDLFREASRVDETLSDAHAWIARVSAGMAAYGWSDDPSADLREGIDAALRAIRLDERNPYGHYGLGVTSGQSDDLVRAKRSLERAIELSPSFALGYIVLGQTNLFSGASRDALEPLRHGFRLNPHDPQNFVWYNVLAAALLFEGMPEEALTWTHKAAQLRPAWRPTYVKMACCLAALGRDDEARAVLSQPGLETSPEDGLGPLRRLQSERVRALRSVLQRAGCGGEF